MMRFAVFLLCLALVYGENKSSSSVHANTSVLQTSSSLHGSASNTVSIGHSSTVQITAVNNHTHTTAVNSTGIMSKTVGPSATSTPMHNSSVHPTTQKTTKPTKKPTTVPPNHGDYSVTGKNGNFCLLAEMKVTLVVTYVTVLKTKNGTTYGKNQTTISMPVKKGNFLLNESSCGKNHSVLVVNWPKQTPLYKLSIEFSAFETAFDYSASQNASWNISMVSVDITTVNNPHFIHANETIISFTGSNAKSEDGSVSVGGRLDGGYQCSKLSYHLIDNSNYNSSSQLSMDNAKFQPFEVTSNIFTKNITHCPKPKPTPTSSPSSNSDIVPIAVGCALAGLVLIVLIAYIIGRRKSQHGYEKV